jgi:hypothetical protein
MGKEQEKPATALPRFLARTVDLFIGGLVVGALFGALVVADIRVPIRSAPTVIPLATVGSLILIFFGPLLMDAVLYGVFGTTPGKALLGIRVEYVPTGKAPGFLRYLARNVSVWVTGMYLGALPSFAFWTLLLRWKPLDSAISATGTRGAYVLGMIALVAIIAAYLPIRAMAAQYSRLKRGDRASYDDSGRFEVYERPVGSLREASAVLLAACALLAGLAALVEPVRGAATLVAVMRHRATTPSLIAARPAAGAATEPGAPGAPRKAGPPGWLNALTGREAALPAGWRQLNGEGTASASAFEFHRADGRVRMELAAFTFRNMPLDRFAEAHQARLSTSATFPPQGRIFTQGDLSTWINEGRDKQQPSHVHVLEVRRANDGFWVLTTVMYGTEKDVEEACDQLRTALWSTVQ